MLFLADVAELHNPYVVQVLSCFRRHTNLALTPSVLFARVRALQDALAKLAAAKSALEAEQQLAAKRGSQVNELAGQVESLKATLGSVSQRATDSQALTSLTEQLSERDDKIAVSFLAGSNSLPHSLLLYVVRHAAEGT